MSLILFRLKNRQIRTVFESIEKKILSNFFNYFIPKNKSYRYSQRKKIIKYKNPQKKTSNFHRQSRKQQRAPQLDRSVIGPDAHTQVETRIHIPEHTHICPAYAYTFVSPGKMRTRQKSGPGAPAAEMHFEYCTANG